MTLTYGEMTYHLSDESVSVEAPGQPPMPADLVALPLPVLRVLRAFRAGLTR